MRTTILFSLGFFLASSSLIRAQVPANDRFAARTLITAAPPVTIPGTTVNATAETGEPGHAAAFGGNVASNSVWYQWTASVSSWAGFSVENAAFDSVVSVYTGTSLGGLVEVASSDRFLVGIEEAFIQAVAGTTYVIAIDAFSSTGAVEGAESFNLTVSLFGTLTNDDFLDAKLLPSQLPTFDLDGFTVGASAEVGEPDHGVGNVASNSVWYRWTAPADAFVGANVDGAADIVVAVYTGSALNSVTLVTSTDQYFNGAPERAVFEATAGVEYWIVIDGYSSNGGVGESGQFILDIYEVPENDDFLFPEVLAGNLAITVEGTTVNGSSEFVFQEPDHATAIAGNLSSNSVWYIWTAPSDANMTVEVRDLVFDPVIAIYTGDALEALTEVAAADSGAGGDAETLGFTATAGVTYIIAVDDWSGSGLPFPGGSFTLELVGTAIGGGPSPYDTWIALFPSLTGDKAEPDANPSGDGIANLTKLVLGLDPTVRLAVDPNRANFPILTTSNGDPVLQYVVVPENLGTGSQKISHGGQVSNDLKSWVGGGLLNTEGNTWVAELQTTGTDASYARIIATIPAS